MCGCVDGVVVVVAVSEKAVARDVVVGGERETPQLQGGRRVAKRARR